MQNQESQYKKTEDQDNQKKKTQKQEVLINTIKVFMIESVL